MPLGLSLEGGDPTVAHRFPLGHVLVESAGGVRACRGPGVLGPDSWEL